MFTRSLTTASLTTASLTTAALTAAALALTTVAPATAEAGSCGGFAYATPFKPGKVSTSNCGVLGDDGVKVYYTWFVGGGSSGKACVEALGYVPLQGPPARSGGNAGYAEQWFSLGCGTRGGSAVPWGDVGATPKVRAESLTVPLGVPVQWRH